MAARILVIGASGEVGEGVTQALLARGYRVVAAARSRSGLDALADRLGHPPDLRCLTGSLETEQAAQALAAAAGPVSGIVVAVNAQRQSQELRDIDSDALTTHLKADLVSHYTAVRCLRPHLPPEGCMIGIGGGSADFLLEGGISMSMAQAALRQMYRGFAHEQQGDGGAALRELIIGSVVAGRHHSRDVDPLWVTAREVGDQVAAMLESPASFPNAVWRIGRRGADGRPVVTAEPAVPAVHLPL